MKKLRKWLARALRCEDGAATLEFALSVPVLITIFMASFESGLLMTRSIMLEQAVDITMRELRLVVPDARARAVRRRVAKQVAGLGRSRE